MHARIIQLDKEGDGFSVKNNITDAIAAANQPNDTIKIVGSDIDTFSGDFPLNFMNGNITFLGKNPNPDSFPVLIIRGSNWNNFWTNTGNCTTRVERVVLQGCSPISNQHNSHKCVIENVVIRGYTNNAVFAINGDNSNAITIKNTIFISNKRAIFPLLRSHNSNSPYGSVTNCTFYGNDTVNADNPSQARSLLTVSNCIFHSSNKNIALTNVLKGAYTYCLLPVSENSTSWGTGYVISDDPKFIKTTPSIASDFRIFKDSPAREKGTTVNAPSVDISGELRDSHPDIGAWEWFDINVAPVGIELSRDSIAENNSIGVLVATFSTIDSNASDTHTYSLISGDTSSFSIRNDSLFAKRVFNFESQSIYSIGVRTIDYGNLSFDTTFTIRITDVNETITGVSISSSVIAENMPIGTLIGRLTSTDPDSNDSHIYSFMSGDTAFFSIQSDSLLSKASFNYEEDSLYTITIRSTDAAAHFRNQSFNIRISDVKEPPESLYISSTTVSENVPANTLIGSFVTIDRDSGSSFTYTFVSGINDNDSFSISENKLLTKSMLDYESKNRYTIMVRSHDGHHSITDTFEIQVTNKNDRPSAINLTDTTAKDSTPKGSIIGTLSTIDQDSNEVFTYSLPVYKDNSYFRIDGDTLKADSVLSFLKKPVYSIRIKVKDKGGDSLTEDFNITILSKPYILKEPSSVTAGEGKSVTFSVEATGLLPIEYKWYSNSAPGVIGSSPTLTINNLSMTHNKSYYYCIVSNERGHTQSKNCTLYVYKKPTITADLKDKITVMTNSPCTLSVAATGDSISYLWIKNGSDTLSLKTSRIIFSSVKASDSGSYQCIVSNIFDTITSTAAFLNVLIPPTFDTLPDSVVVFDGDTAKIRISVSGTPPFSYKWIKNDTDSVGSSTELVIPNVSLSDNGNDYYCIVTGVITESTSKIYLKVRPAPPVIDSQPTTVNIIENQNAVFSIKAHGTAPLQYKWFYLNDLATVLSDSTTLILNKVQITQNNSKIFCQVSNIAGTTSSDTVLLQVYPERPIIFTQPLSQSTNEAKRVKFTVEATGTPPLNFLWFKVGTNDTLSTLDSLVLDPVKKKDAGDYYCIVSNSAGIDTSETATLIVDDSLRAPVITSHPKSQEKYIGDSVVFKVEANGFPLPRFQWFLNNKSLPDDTTNTLVLRGVSFDNNLDSIKCMVFNSEGTIYCSTAVLTITPAPVADFNATPTTIPVNGSVQFTNASSGIYTDVIWNFGDGITSTEESPEHIFVKTGLYDVSLIVTGRAGSDTMVKTGFVYVYKEGENPVRISAKYLRGTEIEITLSNLDKIEPQVFPPVYDSLGIWISKVSLPENVYTSEKLVTYSRNVFKNKSSFIDTLSLPQAKITWYLMSGLYLTNGKISAFNAGNGTEVALMDKTPPYNPFSISGRHLGGDSVLITLIASSPLDTEKVDSVLFCFAFDSVGLDYRGQFSSSFSTEEFTKSSIVEKKIFNEVFSIGSHLMWCGVKLKGKNDSLSLPVTSSFLTENANISNPIVLSAQAISSSAIRLSWNDLNPDSVSGIRIWYSVNQIPLGTLKRSDYSLIELNSSQNSCIVEFLNYSTSYCFAAQVVNKQGIWSEITEKARVSIKTPEPSDSTAVPNTITLHSPRFDTLSASIKLSWCIDTIGIGDDSLELGISFSHTGFESEISQINQILPVKGICDSVALKLQKISFNTEYFISMWLRKKGGRWALPVQLSQNYILTPNFSREPVTFFDPVVIFDTVFAFNDQLILSKDSRFGVKDVFSNTAVFYPGNQYNGMVVVGNGFHFAQTISTPAFWIGLRYTVPVGFRADKVKLYRESANGVLVEHDATNDTLRKIVSVYTNKTDLPFILLIDTVAPVLNFKGDIDKKVFPGKSTTDTVTITDNILNAKYQFCYSTGKDPQIIRIDTVISGKSQQLILTVPKEFSSIETGIRAELRVTDGNNSIIRNLSKQVHIDKVETRIFPLQWTPFSVSAQLSSTSPDSLIKRLAESDSSNYDGRYARVFYWLPTAGNITANDRWVEYGDKVKSLFNLSPGKTFWIKTLNEKSINLGSALTMSLKDTVKIVLPKKEFTDLTLPYNFPVRIKDVIEASGMDSLAIYRWSNDSGAFITKGYYIPGKANHQNINDSLDWKYHNAYYSVYNMYNKEITLKIPPVPVSMSPGQPLKKQAHKNAWGITVNCRIDSSQISEVYCGYADKAGQIYYPPSPGFVGSRVKIFNRKANRFFGDYICGDLSSGGLAQELVFENKESHPVQFSFCMTGEGDIPSGFGSSILNTATGEWEKSGMIMVGANNVEYRWFVIAGKDFMEHFKNSALSWKYGLRSVYANPLRNAAIFKFTIPTGAKEKVRFTIFNAMGRMIWEKTISHPLSSGEHSLIWNGDNTRGGKVSNGMYFVKFSILDSKGKTSKSFNSRLVYVH